MKKYKRHNKATQMLPIKKVKKYHLASVSQTTMKTPVFPHGQLIARFDH